MLEAGVIATQPWQACYPSPLFFVPKASGGDRVVIDLSHLNRHILCPTFQMLTVHTRRNSVPRGALFTSIDLSDAFHHIPIHPRFLKYLAFTHAETLYFFQAMPFGINLGPRIFSLVIAEVLKLVHSLGIRASVYIGDWLLWNLSHTPRLTHTHTVLRLLQNLGFTVSTTKPLLTPSPTITYLGIL